MASNAVARWRLILPEGMNDRLQAQLFPGDGDEHGAVILAGVAISDRGLRLIGRELYLARDGIDYVAGERGYRMLRADFIRDCIIRARDQRLAYLAIHNHGGTTHVEFSGDDLASHERGYPALLDVARGMPVGALVFAREAVAGDLWFSGRRRASLSEAIIVGSRRKVLTSSPPRPATKNERYDRQARLFGDAGQVMLRTARVGIIGLGGAGSILAELLGRLGVGNFVLADPDRAEPSNLPRLVGASPRDAVKSSRVVSQSLARRLSSRKVDMAARNIRRANPGARVKLLEDFLDQEAAGHFTDCDYIFLAADTMSARLLFNAVVHQYGIAGCQVGAKVPVNPNTGAVGDVFCVARPVTPESGCLVCNGLIDAAKLQEEATPKAQRERQRYVDEPEVVAPSVITLNAIACAHAADEFLFHFTGLKYHDAAMGYFRWHSRRNESGRDEPRKDPGCSECSVADQSRLGRGDQCPLPLRVRYRRNRFSRQP